jgi:hypothetical protein
VPSSRSIIIATVIIAAGLLFIYVTAASAIFLLGFLFVVALVGTVFFRDEVQNLFLAATVLFLALLVAEATAMMFERHEFRTERNFAGPRLIVGWGPLHPGRFRAQRTVNGKAIYDVFYTFDDRLLRKTHSGSSGDGIAFFGDSFIFGEGIEDSQTLPQQFADLEGRRYPVYNLAYLAYNPAQALAEMQTGVFDDLLAKSGVFVEFVAPWHAGRTTCKDYFVRLAPSYVIAGDRVLFQGYCEPRISPLTYFSTYRTFFQPRFWIITDNDVATLVQVTEETIRMAAEKYKKPIVIYYLRNPGFLRRLHWTDDQIMDEFRSAGAKVLDYALDDDSRYSIPNDGHPSPLANRVRANRLLTFLQHEFPQFGTAEAPR